jgi:hypothetical protein
MALEASIELVASGSMTNPLDLSTPINSVAVGTGDFPECLIELEDGNGAEQAQAHWHDLRTVTATTADNLDLYGSLTGPFGSTVSVVKIKTILVVIDTPGTTKSLRIGPQNVANANQLGFGGTGATVYATCRRFLLLEDVDSGWTVSNGSTDVLGIYNPSAVSVTYAIWISYTTS